VDAATLWTGVPSGALHAWHGAGARWMTLSNAMLGLGTASPAYALDVAGAIRATGDITAFSDARVKRDVVRIERALEKVEAINGYTFARTDLGGPGGAPDGRRYLGVLAQEVLEVVPEVVQGSLEIGLSVAYGNLAALLVEAVKDVAASGRALAATHGALAATHGALAATVGAMQATMDTLSGRLDRLEGKA
jgi:hypothetical protein